MAASLLPDDHPLRSHKLTVKQLEAILAADALRAATDMQVGKTQRERVTQSLLLKG
jgi:hypothetical protein